MHGNRKLFLILTRSWYSGGKCSSDCECCLGNSTADSTLSGDQLFGRFAMAIARFGNVSAFFFAAASNACISGVGSLPGNSRASFTLRKLVSLLLRCSFSLFFMANSMPWYVSNWLRKFLFGLMQFRLFLTCSSASLKLHPYAFIAYAITHDAERLMPILQWTRTFEPEFFACEIYLNVLSQCFSKFVLSSSYTRTLK